MPRLHIAQNDRADAVISEHPFGLLVGMLLEQQIAMEVAFSGPAKIYDRFGTLDPTKIAAIQLDRDGGVSGTSPTLGEGRRAAREGYEVYAAEGETTIGSVTSGALSPTLGYPIAMAYVSAEAQDNGVTEGATVEVDIRGKRHPYTVVKLPFYTREK